MRDYLWARCRYLAERGTNAECPITSKEKLKDRIIEDKKRKKSELMQMGRSNRRERKGFAS